MGGGGVGWDAARLGVNGKGACGDSFVQHMQKSGKLGKVFEIGTHSLIRDEK